MVPYPWHLATPTNSRFIETISRESRLHPVRRRSTRTVPPPRTTTPITKPTTIQIHTAGPPASEDGASAVGSGGAVLVGWAVEAVVVAGPAGGVGLGAAVATATVRVGVIIVGIGLGRSVLGGKVSKMDGLTVTVAPDGLARIAVPSMLLKITSARETSLCTGLIARKVTRARIPPSLVAGAGWVWVIVKSTRPKELSTRFRATRKSLPGVSAKSAARSGPASTWTPVTSSDRKTG